MAESQSLVQARQWLHAVEEELFSENSAFKIEQGFDALEEIVLEQGAECEVAKNLSIVYFHRIYHSLANVISQKFIPEPKLKMMLQLAQALEATPHVSSELETLRVGIAERLLDSYFEGYSETERECEIRRLKRLVERK